MNLNAITGILAKVAPELFKIIDKSIKDPDLSLKLKHEITSQMLSADSEAVKAASSVTIAEVQGESWLQRNWRPMLMIWFSILIGAYWFGFVPSNMPVSVIDQLFTLVQIGVGGYVVGRSAEKVTSQLAPALKNR